jgi:hypothetical protein
LVLDYFHHLPKGNVMRSSWRYRLAGLAGAIAVALAAGPGQLAIASAAHAAVTADGPICPAGTHWDDVLNICR